MGSGILLCFTLFPVLLLGNSLQDLQGLQRLQFVLHQKQCSYRALTSRLAR